ncbi:MAG: methionyl-tRNA formyltransferase [Methylocystaceae bacterium]|nr:MAG: methionyl-tRNA formyltransferase [Methylocystaceae bacterium]
MRVVFMGTPDFAVPLLEKIVADGHEVAAVYTRAPSPAGRGMELRLSPVHRLAEKLSIPVFTPKSLKSAEEIAAFAAHRADVGVVVAYGLILPQAVLDAPRFGCLNLHGSLLPRWRGAAPIQRAILAGDAETGVSIMQMEAGLDTGPVLLAEAVAIATADTAGSLHDKLATVGGRLIVVALDKLAKGPLAATPQLEAGVTYAAKIDKAEATIDWARPAAEIDRQIRAFNPFPGAATRLGGAAVKLWRAIPDTGSGAPGTVLAVGRDGIVVACGVGVLRLVEVQKAGGKRLGIEQFLAGNRVAVGDRLGGEA